MLLGVSSTLAVIACGFAYGGSIFSGFTQIFGRVVKKVEEDPPASDADSTTLDGIVQSVTDSMQTQIAELDGKVDEAADVLKTAALGFTGPRNGATRLGRSLKIMRNNVKTLVKTKSMSGTRRSTKHMVRMLQNLNWSSQRECQLWILRIP